MNNWKTLNRKTIDKALQRAIDSIADLITIIDNKGKSDTINTIEIENLIHKLKRIVDVENGK